MASVFLPLEVAREFASGVVEHDVAAGDLRQLLRELDATFPGISERLKTGLAVAINGEILQDWFLEDIPTGAEVRFLPAIEGG